MAINPDTVKAGDTLYKVVRRKAGNTTMSVESVDEAHILDIEQSERGRRFIVSKRYRSWLSEYEVRRLRKSPPEWVYSMLFEPRRCHICHRNKEQGHSDTCDHPAAVKARAKAAKRAP